MKKEYRYEGMSNEQIAVLNQFTQFRSATNIQKKMAAVIGDTEIVKDWTYDGYRDTGYKGGDHCSMGHALRYVHFAKNKKSGDRIKFGIKCISDFFEITVDKLKMIQDGFVQVNKMVDQIVERFKSGSYRFEEMKTKFSQLIQYPEHKYEIELLFSVDLPLPSDYDNEINNIWFREYSAREFQKFLDENPTYLGIVTMAQLCEASDSFKGKHPKLYAKMKDITKYLNKNKRLSEPQIKLLNKIMMMDHEVVDAQIESLRMLPAEAFLRREGYDELAVLNDLIGCYEEWGLTANQVALIEKIHNRHLKKINAIKDQQLQMAEAE